MGTNYHNEALRKQRVVDRQRESVMRMVNHDTGPESAARNELRSGKKAVEDVIRYYHNRRNPPSDPTWIQIKRDLLLDDLAMRNSNLYTGYPSTAVDMVAYERKHWKGKSKESAN
ncbi:uncharacterized protein LOC135490813 isoform X2 [Lineus longissimus]|uniref:uncharacterized protein LOC135490813 isoform X2 n=1 Tax=Lineus longissimus TaxID=88925 RepID=UPI00315D7789